MTTRMCRHFPAVTALLLCCTIISCAGPFPLRPGESITYAKAQMPNSPDPAGHDQTLQIRWLGTMCTWIQLGDVAVLTDPYFSHFASTRVAFGRIESDKEAVGLWTRDLPRPKAIFIGHAHYDHMLDLRETLRQRSWMGIPIYAGPTAANIAAGYGEDLERNFVTPQTNSPWVEIDGPRLAYRAFPAQHAPHLPGINLFRGMLTAPRTSPPTRARDFPVGETFTYLLRFRGGDRAEFTVFIAGAATNADCGIPDLPEGVDVAILCVPGWKNVHGYPDEVIRRLRPRVILLAHLDNFLQEGWRKRELVPTADLAGFLDRARRVCDYPRFERLVITDVGSTVRVTGVSH